MNDPFASPYPLKFWGCTEACGSIALLLSICVGCSAKPVSAKAPNFRPMAATAAPVDPHRRLYEQFHAAAFQAGQALESLNDAVSELEPLSKDESGDTKAALEQIVSSFEDAGRSVEPYSESPEQDAIRKSPGDAETRRKKGIEDLNAASQTINAAQSTIDDLIASGPPADIVKSLKTANDDGDDSVTALSEAVKQLGGTPVEKSDP